MTAKSNFLKSELDGAMRAAAAAGFTKTRMIKHPDGRLEIIAEYGVPTLSDDSGDTDSLSAFEQWERDNAR